MPKPRRRFPRFPLPVAVVFVDQVVGDSEILSIAAPEVGIAERPLKGQDAALVDRARNLYGVFDGVGSNMYSDIAARLAAVTAQEFIAKSSAVTPEEVEESLAAALHEAHVTIAGWSQTAPAGTTTATLAQIVHENGNSYLAWASVGDTRLYLKTAGQLHQITTDEGSGSTITNSLGRYSFYGGVHERGVIKLPDDYELVLCSDGITGDEGGNLLSSAEILQVLDESPSSQMAADKLLAISRKQDDKVCIVVRGN